MESTATSPVRKSARVVLTVAAAMGMARGQLAPDPCDPGTFNIKACKVAVQHSGYCDGSTWVPTTYQEHYPYYYDSYQAYLSTGGVVTAAETGNCRRPHSSFFGRGISRGGFGSTGAGHHHAGG